MFSPVAELFQDNGVNQVTKIFLLLVVSSALLSCQVRRPRSAVKSSITYGKTPQVIPLGVSDNGINYKQNCLDWSLGHEPDPFDRSTWSKSGLDINMADSRSLPIGLWRPKIGPDGHPITEHDKNGKVVPVYEEIFVKSNGEPASVTPAAILTNVDMIYKSADLFRLIGLPRAPDQLDSSYDSNNLYAWARSRTFSNTKTYILISARVGIYSAYIYNALTLEPKKEILDEITRDSKSDPQSISRAWRQKCGSRYVSGATYGASMTIIASFDTGAKPLSTSVKNPIQYLNSPREGLSIDIFSLGGAEIDINQFLTGQNTGDGLEKYFSAWVKASVDPARAKYEVIDTSLSKYRVNLAWLHGRLKWSPEADTLDFENELADFIYLMETYRESVREILGHPTQYATTIDARGIPTDEQERTSGTLSPETTSKLEMQSQKYKNSINEIQDNVSKCRKLGNEKNICFRILPGVDPKMSDEAYSELVFNLRGEVELNTINLPRRMPDRPIQKDLP